MKKGLFCLVLVLLVLMTAGCRDERYLPEAKNDKIYTTIYDGKSEPVVAGNGETTAMLHKGEGYSLSVPERGYGYEKDYDDGALEEIWESTRRDDAELRVTTYRGMDLDTARKRFLRDNDDYIIEDLTGSPICGREPDGDVLWFALHEGTDAVFIVSWEYPKSADETLIAELSVMAESFVVE